MRPPVRSWKHTPEVVEEVFILADGGWNPASIARIMAGRKRPVSESTIRRWIDPDIAERDRKANRAAVQRRRDERRRQRPDDPFGGMVGLSRKVAELEARVTALESP